LKGLAQAKARFIGRERPLADVPLGVWLLLGAAFLAQLAWHGVRPSPTAYVGDLRAPPSAAAMRVLAMGEPVAAARLSFLWLQSFDDPPGVTVPLKDLNYRALAAWLNVILELDPRGSAPLLAASKVYSTVPDPERQRLMLDFVHQSFLKDPNERWRWLAHVALLARHRLRDLDLALHYAKSLNERTRPDVVPAWARALALLILEDQCELESAKVMLGGLLATGNLADDSEVAFLERKLAELERTVGCPQRVEEQFPFLAPRNSPSPLK
jgi:hypothetical protein